MSTTAKALIDFDEYRREELINGEVVMMSPPTARHSTIVRNITEIFSFYLRGKSCRVYPDNLLVCLSEKHHFIPDVTVICDRDKMKDDGYHGAPDLVVEILSPRTAQYDRGKKKAAYREAGVREYWLVDPTARSVEVYHLQEGSDVVEVYFAPSVADRGKDAPTEFPCGIFPDLIIRLEDVFDGMIDFT